MKLSENQRNNLNKYGKVGLSIGIGTLVGLLTYVICLIIHFDIFGWNFGLILGPLFAGYVETYIANKILNESTGAISAFILFIVTVIYGFIINNPTLGINIITFGSIILILQAAIPTLINYFIILFIIGMVSYTLGIFKRINNWVYKNIVLNIYKILGKEKTYESNSIDSIEYDETRSNIHINNLGILFLTITDPSNISIKNYKGIYEGKVIIPNQNRYISTRNSEKENYLRNLQKAKDQAIENLSKELKSGGCNGIIDFTIEYDIIGEISPDSYQIVARGTGVVLSKFNKK